MAMAARSKEAGKDRATWSGAGAASEREAVEQELRDEAEYLAAELDFRSVEAEMARKHLSDADKAGAEVAEALAHMGDLQLRRLANACYDECVQQRVNMQNNADKLHDSEVALLAAKRSLQEAQVEVQALREAHDSEKTRIQQEYEEQVAFIIEQLQDEQANHQILGKLSPSIRAISAARTPM